MGWSMTEVLLIPDFVYVKGAFSAGLGVLMKDDTITAVGPEADLLCQAPHAYRRSLEGQALLPGCVNSHNHSFQSLVRGFGDDLPFLEWRARGIYKYSLNLDADGLYVGALLAFGEMLKNGITTVCDFFYLNSQSNDNANAIIRAARDVGIRLQLARCFYDWDGAPKSYRETIDQAKTNARALFRQHEGARDVSIAIAPHSPHGASAEMVKAAVEVQRELGCPMHIHVAEEKFEVEDTLKHYGTTPVRWLKDLGALSEKTVCVHCVWIDHEEIRILADAGASLAYNPSSNMFLGDGITRITEMLSAKINIALGTDGGCSNNRVSIFDEMRMTSLLQKVRHIDGAAISAEACFPMGNQNGGRALRQPIGEIAPGMRADLVAIDLRDLSLQPANHLLKNVVYAMSAHAIRETIVGGRTVYENGTLLKMSEEDILAKVVGLTKDWQ
jgi:5-methylthioadenosine/S-adenosylhomocysteine deaminase